MPPSDAFTRLLDAGPSESLARILLVDGASQNVQPSPSEMERWARRVLAGEDPEISGRRTNKGRA